MRDITEQVEATIAKLTRTIEIDEITDNGDDTFRIDTCNTYWLRPCKTVTIDSLVYLIDSFVIDESITISGNPLPTATSFDIPPPFFKHGTPIGVNAETMDLDNDLITPLAWLLKNLSTTTFEDEVDPFDYESTIRLFFLDEYQTDNARTDVLLIDAIRPMDNLKKEFLIEVEKDGAYDDVDNYTTKDWYKFGEVVTRGTKIKPGSEKKILDKSLSGVELTITLKVMKSTICDDCNVC